MSEEIPESTAAEQPAAPPEVRERHAALSKEIEDHRVKYYLGSSIISDADFDALMHELQAIEEQYNELRTPDSPTQKVGIPISTLFTPVQHPMRMESLGERVLRRADGGVGQAAGARGDAAADPRQRLHLRAEGRRARPRPGLRERHAGQRRHPRRRPHRRGRDAQRPHDQEHPERAGRQGPAVLPGGPRRGLLPRRGLRGAERAAGRGGQGPVLQPAQQRRRIAAAEGPQGVREPPAALRRPRPRPRRRLSRPPAVLGVRAAQGLGPAGQRPRPQGRDARPGQRVHRVLRREPALRRPRDRRCRGEGGRGRPAARARLDLERARAGRSRTSTRRRRSPPSSSTSR